MPLRKSSLFIPALALIIAGSVRAMPPQQNQERGFVFISPVIENTAVRFFYIPPGDYFHFPLVVRAVDQGDPRINTAPMSAEGRTAYVSLVEMQQLMQLLAHSNLSWQESETVEILGSFKQLAMTGSMEVLVVSSKGTAKAKVSPRKICETLKPLDSAIKTQRALWEFQGFRLGYDCEVPGFKYGAYPDH